MTIEKSLQVMSKELAYKKHYGEIQIKQNPSQKKRIEGDISAMELGIEILKEVRDKQQFLQLESLKK